MISLEIAIFIKQLFSASLNSTIQSSFFASIKIAKCLIPFIIMISVLNFSAFQVHFSINFLNFPSTAIISSCAIQKKFNQYSINLSIIHISIEVLAESNQTSIPSTQKISHFGRLVHTIPIAFSFLRNYLFTFYEALPFLRLNEHRFLIIKRGMNMKLLLCFPIQVFQERPICDAHLVNLCSLSFNERCFIMIIT